MGRRVPGSADLRMGLLKNMKHAITFLSFLSITLSVTGMEPTREALIKVLKQKWASPADLSPQAMSGSRDQEIRDLREFSAHFDLLQGYQELLKKSESGHIADTKKLIKVVVEGAMPSCDEVNERIIKNMQTWTLSHLVGFTKEPLFQELTQWAVKAEDASLLFGIGKELRERALKKRSEMTREEREQLNWAALCQFKNVYELPVTAQTNSIHNACEKIIITLARHNAFVLTKENIFTSAACNFITQDTALELPGSVMLFHPPKVKKVVPKKVNKPIKDESKKANPVKAEPKKPEQKNINYGLTSL